MFDLNNYKGANHGRAFALVLRDSAGFTQYFLYPGVILGVDGFIGPYYSKSHCNYVWKEHLKRDHELDYFEIGGKLNENIERESEG